MIRENRNIIGDNFSVILLLSVYFSNCLVVIYGYKHVLCTFSIKWLNVNIVTQAYLFIKIECYRHIIYNLDNCATLVLSPRLIAANFWCKHLKVYQEGQTDQHGGRNDHAWRNPRGVRKGRNDLILSTVRVVNGSRFSQVDDRNSSLVCQQLLYPTVSHNAAFKMLGMRSPS